MLTKAGLWNEVKDRLGELGGALSGGQQQRLCIARALAVRPRVLLMDEPCSALDPTSTRRIEETINEIADEVTVVIVTHNMQQAQRVSDHCAFFLAEENQPGRVVESGRTETMFLNPPTRGPSTMSTAGSAERAACSRRCGRRGRGAPVRRAWCAAVQLRWARRCRRAASPSHAVDRFELRRRGHPAVGGPVGTLYGLNINWQVSSSVIGLNNFAQNQVDFAASDIPYSSGQAESTTRPCPTSTCPTWPAVWPSCTT